MPRESLTVGQLAKRWAIGVDRVRSLVMSCQLPGAFTIPSSGRYGATVKIPLTAVLQAEQDWAIAPQLDGHPSRKRRRPRDGLPPKLKHFPELNDRPAAGIGCDEVAQDRPEDRPR